MSKYDVWLCRYEGSLWFTWAYPGEPPMGLPERVDCVKDLFKYMKAEGIEVGQVGIADAAMLGLNVSEV